MDGSWPVLEDAASYGYYREEGGGLMLGMFEPVCAPWKVDGIPEDFSFGELPPDWDRMAPYLETTMSRVPITSRIGIRKFFCGPESFTPDLLPIVGEAPELRNYFVAAGLNSIGILTGGGIGRTIAQWITSGSPDIDVTAMNIDRLHPYQANPEYLATRTVESLGLVYSCHYPNRPAKTARGARLSPIHTAWWLSVLASGTSAAGRAPTGTRRRASSRRSASCPGAGRPGSATGSPSTRPRATA